MKTERFNLHVMALAISFFASSIFIAFAATITPLTATPALHSTEFGGILSARPRILWDSISANGGVPPQLWNKTSRKTRAKANEIRAFASQLRPYGMIVSRFGICVVYGVLWVFNKV